MADDYLIIAVAANYEWMQIIYIMHAMGAAWLIVRHCKEKMIVVHDRSMTKFKVAILLVYLAFSSRICDPLKLRQSQDRVFFTESKYFGYVSYDLVARPNLPAGPNYQYARCLGHNR